MQHILDFCNGCGILIPEGMGTLPENKQVCENCGGAVFERDQRIQGVFEEEEAFRLRLALG